MGPKSDLSIKFLESLVNNSEEGVTVEKSRYHIALHPAQLQDFTGALRDEIGRRVARYDKKLSGILLGFKNVIPASSLGKIGSDNLFIHLDIEAEFFIFRPEVGMVLNGVVTKCSKDHVGCLVYKTFNASLPRSAADTEHEEIWLGSKAQPGEQVSFQIVFLDLESRLPYIRGKILSLGDSSLDTFGDQEIQNSISSKKTKKHKKDKHVNTNANEENCKETEEMDINDLPLKKKKSKKRKHNESEFEDILSNRFEDEYDSPKKKKKKNSFTFESTDIESSLSNRNSSNITEEKEDSPRKKKSKKKYLIPESNPNETSFSTQFNNKEDTLYNQKSSNFTEDESLHKKKKSKKSSLTFESSQIQTILSTQGTNEETVSKKKKRKNKPLSPILSQETPEDIVTAPKKQNKKEKRKSLSSQTEYLQNEREKNEKDFAVNSLTFQTDSGSMISSSENISISAETPLVSSPNKQNKKANRKSVSSKIKEKITTLEYIRNKNDKHKTDFTDEAIDSVVSRYRESSPVSAEIPKILGTVPKKENKKARRKSVCENAMIALDHNDHNLPIQRRLSIDSNIKKEKQKIKNEKEFTDSDSFEITINEVVEKFCSDSVPDLENVSKGNTDRRKNITIKNKDNLDLEKERDTSVKKLNKGTNKNSFSEGNASDSSIEQLRNIQKSMKRELKTPTRDSTSKTNAKKSQNDSDSSLDRFRASKKVKTEPKTPVGSPVRDIPIRDEIIKSDIKKEPIRDLSSKKLLKQPRMDKDNSDSSSGIQTKEKSSDYVIRSRVNGIVSDWEVEDFSHRRKNKKIRSKETTNEVKEEIFSDGENLKQKAQKKVKERNRSKSLSIYDKKSEIKNEVKEVFPEERKSKKKDRNSKSLSLDEKDLYLLFSSPTVKLKPKTDDEQTIKKKRKGSLSRSLDYSEIKMEQSSDIDDVTENFSFSKNKSLNDLGLHTEIDLGIKDDYGE